MVTSRTTRVSQLQTIEKMTFITCKQSKISNLRIIEDNLLMKGLLLMSRNHVITVGQPNY